MIRKVGMMSKALTRIRRGHRGYTVVEVMMALSVLAVGGMGVVALQKFAVVSSVNSRGITSASAVADSWIDLCQNEAAAWNARDNTDIANMPIVAAALGSAGNWVNIPVVAGETDPGVGGATRNYGDTTGLFFFCSQIRATWMGAPNLTAANGTTNNSQPSDVIRIDVRTWFAKSGRGLGDATTGECASWTAGDVDTMLATDTGTAPDPYGGAAARSRYEYGWVFVSGTIRRNTL